MTTYEEIEKSCTIHLLNDDMSNSIDITSHINVYYRMLRKALDKAANVNIYKSKSKFYKFWWDKRQNIVKKNSISAHNQWFLDGKPHSRSVFVAMNRAKLQYKNAIRSK